MDTDEIVSEIDAEISRLQQARALLTGTETIRRKPGRPAGVKSPGKATSFNPETFAGKSKTARTLSPEARPKIAAAQEARWARKAAKNAVHNATAASKGIASKKAPVKKAVARKNAAPPEERDAHHS